MTISAIRTITLTHFSTYENVFHWPNIQVGSDEDFAVNAEFWLNDITDSIERAEVKIQPSGDEELQALDLFAIGNTVAVRLANPVAGRLYTISLAFESMSGRKLTMIIELQTDATLCGVTIPPPFSYDFGTPIIWVNGVTSYGNEFGAVEYVTAAGTIQATATPLQAQVNIINAGAINTGVLLSQIVSGTLIVQNDTDTDKYIWPLVGSHIVVAGTNAGTDNPIIVSPGQRMNCSTSPSSVEWVAA